MKSTLETIVAVLVVAAVGAILAPFALVGIQIARTWSVENTNQVLGGGLVCGGGLAVLAAGVISVLVGAGIQRRMAALAPPGRQAPVEEPPALPVQIYPPFGLPGGGDIRLLPSGRDDTAQRLYGYTAELPDVAQRKERDA